MIVCFASLMHLLWGVLLLINQGGIHITATATVYQLVVSYETRAILYIASGLLPLVLLISPRWTLTGLLACFPQLVLLVLSGIAALTAVTSSIYPDGTVRSWQFIFMDQGIYILLPVLYAFETLDRFHDQSLAKHAPTPRIKQVFLSHAEGDVRVDARVTVQEKGERGEKGEKGDRGERGPVGP